MRWLAQRMRAASGAGGQWLSRSGGPAARRVGLAIGRSALALTAATARKAWRHRGIALGLAARAAWCASLWLGLCGTQVLLGLAPIGDKTEILRPFVMGMMAVCAVVCLSSERHLRRGAMVLGALHAALIVVAWTAVSAAG